MRSRFFVTLLFAGRPGEGRLVLDGREHRLTSELTVLADEPMPVTVGWHPGFAGRPAAAAPRGCSPAAGSTCAARTTCRPGS
jgi:hypothetical protein